MTIILMNLYLGRLLKMTLLLLGFVRPETTDFAALSASTFPSTLWTDHPQETGAPKVASETSLYVMGLFGKTGLYPAGTAFQIAAEMAVIDINNSSDVLPGYSLILDSADTKCEIAEGVEQLYRRLYNKNITIMMVLGATCSHVTEITTQVSRSWNLVQITYSALSPTLSNKDEFPWFFRVVAPENVLSFVFVQLLRHFNWVNVSIVQQNYQLFTTSVELMKKELERYNISLDHIQPFDTDPVPAIRSMQDNDVRIIFVACYEEQARQACCQAYRAGYYGPNIVWIFPGFYDRYWYLPRDEVNCTVDEILEVIDGYFAVTSVNVDINEDLNDTISGWPTSEFQCRFCAHFSSQSYSADAAKTIDCFCDRHINSTILAGSNRAPLAYDAMWAVALALNDTLTNLIAEGLRLEEFTYGDSKIAQQIFHSMKNTSFKGITGNISFSSSGDSISTIIVRQFHRSSDGQSGKFVKVGIYEGCTEEIVWSKDTPTWTQGASSLTVGLYKGCPDKMLWMDDNVRWRNDEGVPLSYRRTDYIPMPLSRQLYVVMCSMARIGMLLSFIFLAFNLICRIVRLIKMSSPYINNLILAGCLLVYATIGMEDINAESLHVLCYLHQYFLILGFSLGYGALFAKTWRVYEIMTASIRLKTKVLRDSRLFMTVAVLVAVNLAVLVIRTAIDPITLVPVDIGEKIDDEEKAVWVLHQSLVCQSQYRLQFTATFLSLQGLLLLFGVFLAWQTRRTSIPELNDSRWIGMCIYNVVVLGSLGVIFVTFSTQSPDVNYLFKSAVVFAATTLTQCFIFAPKLLAYMQYRKTSKNEGELSAKTFQITTTFLSATKQATRQSSLDTHPSLSSTNSIANDSGMSDATCDLAENIEMLLGTDLLQSEAVRRRRTMTLKTDDKGAQFPDWSSGQSPFNSFNHSGVCIAGLNTAPHEDNQRRAICEHRHQHRRLSLPMPTCLLLAASEKHFTPWSFLKNDFE